MTQTYVYKGKEVFLTGRKAIKKSSRGTEKELWEVLPKKYIDKEVDGFVTSDWIQLKDLYQIMDINTNTEEGE
jgi:hypothetical protein